MTGKIGRKPKDIKVSYEDYVKTMSARGLKKDVKTFESWTKTIKDPKDSTKTIVVCGESGESNADKFKRLGTSRLNAALKQIKSIKNLSASGYEFTPEQVDIIDEKLREAVSDTVMSFRGKTAETESVKL